MNVALPLLSVPEPSVVVPFLKVTLPLGVPPVEVTVAAKVTAAPNVEGFGDDVKDVKEVEVVAMKVAVTALAEFMVTGQLPVPVHSPLQPAKTELTVGFAVKITVAPATKFATQVPGQLIPGGLLVTELVATPGTVTVNAWVRGRV